MTITDVVLEWLLMGDAGSNGRTVAYVFRPLLHHRPVPRFRDDIPWVVRRFSRM